MPYYLAANPGTLVSLIHSGRMPDQFFEWYGPGEIHCYQDPKVCATSLTMRVHQVFLLELHLPELSESEDLTRVLAPNPAHTYIATRKINPSWIQKILVYSPTGANLAKRLLNSESPVPITQSPELFSNHQMTAVSAAAIPVVVEPRCTVTLMRKGDLLGSTMQTLINTVNCVGIMGKGIALAFKHHYPDMFKDYKNRCQSKAVKLGEPYLYRVNRHRQILNFPTKNHWRNASKIEDIEAGLIYLANQIKTQKWNITSLAIPPLGCGNGGLDWSKVKPLVLKHLTPLKIALEIYEPFTQSKPKKRGRQALVFQQSPHRSNKQQCLEGGSLPSSSSGT